MVGSLIIAGISLFVLSIQFRTPNRPEAELGQLLAAVALIIIAGRVLGEIVARLGQPRVMGEVLGGILLGPSLIGSVPEWFPDLAPLLCGLATCPADWPFSTHLQTELRAAAEIGLVFYMFLVGLELDPQVLRGRLRQAAAISLSSIALPFTLGIGAAVLLIQRFPELGDTDRPVAFAIFMGVSMSITAFPVLARILIERRMLRGPIGSLALACAAIDDVAAWALLAVASALAVSSAMPAGQITATVADPAPGAMMAPPDPVVILILAVAFVLVMGLIARPVMARVSHAYDEAGHVPAGWVVAIFLAVLGAAFLSQRVGIAAIFGAFVMGLIMPRHSGLTHDISRRIEDFVVVVLLPLFFVVAGLRADVGPLFDQPELWPIALGLIAIAIGGKWVGAMVAARLTGSEWRASAAIGALMNTRGLTELIVLYAGLNLGVIGQDLFTMLVLMALVTTFMAGPALGFIDPHGRLARTPEEEVRAAAPPPASAPRPAPARAILVACQDPKNLDSLTALAEALASAGEPREVILVRLVQPSPLTTRFATQRRALTEATEEVRVRVAGLVERGRPARGVALSSARIGEDLTSLAADEKTDLVITDGRHSIARPGQPGGAVRALLEDAECDVAVLIERRTAPSIDAGHALLVPFGGSDHDWAAVELAAWFAHVGGARLRLVGIAGEGTDGRDAGRLLANAALAIQGLSGVIAEPSLVEPGRIGILSAADDAGLLIVGLSSRWRQEGLGEVRTAIALEASVPTLFVRRGSRPGALAPSETMTMFRWSSAGIDPYAAPPPPASPGIAPVAEHDETNPASADRR